MKKVIFVCAIWMLSVNVSAEESEVMVCEIRAPKKIQNIESEIGKQNCQKGDLLLIRDMKMTARYKRVAAHVCDFSKKITNFDSYAFICHYQGFSRQSRNPDYN